MKNPGVFLKTRLAHSMMLLVVLVASSCAPSQQQGAHSPLVNTAEVTRLVTRDVTVEVTRLVELAVTVTPSATSQFTLTPSLTPTITDTPTITPTPELPQLTILQYTDCLYGPGEDYLYKTSYPAGSRVEAVGRSQDALWVNVEEIHGWNACWIPASLVQLDRGSVADLPFVYSSLPLVRYDYSSPTAVARRDGDDVLVSWEAIWMSRYELRGYLIEAWVCQAGRHIFLPIHIFPTYEENVSTVSITIKDETGCVESSNARIATASKRGYTPFEKIFWPPP